jgi:hypothetical protein
MAALSAVRKFVEMLRGLPAALIAPERIGLRRPAAGTDLPMIAVALARAREGPAGLGGFVSLTQVAPEEWASTTGSRCQGELRAEIWAASAAAVEELTEAVLQRLASQAGALRAGGFVDLSLSGLGPAQPEALGQAAALSMALTFDATFEDLVTPPPGGEGVIRNVHVEVTGELAESLDIR